MKRWRRNSLILLVLCATAAIVAAPVMLAGDDGCKRSVNRGTVRISATDDEGNRQEEVFEFDDEHPQPFLGVNLENADGRGARVERVIEGSPAERAGLQEGDVIVRFDGAAVDSSWDLTRRVWRSTVGQRVELEVERDGRTQHMPVELAQHEAWSGDFDFEGMEVPDSYLDFDFDFDFDTEQFEQHLEEMKRHLEGLRGMKLDMDFDFPGFDDLGGMGFGSRRPVLGIELVETTPELREHLGGDSETGVLVGRVQYGMPAEAAGVRVGDMIVKVDGEAIENAGDLRRALDDRRGQSFSIEVLRDKRAVSLDVTLPSREDDASDDDETPSSRLLRLAPARGLGAATRS
jgi:predicted metalloprotease with PDZ domain